MNKAQIAYFVHGSVVEPMNDKILVYTMGSPLDQSNEGAPAPSQPIGILMSAKDARQLVDQLQQALQKLT